MKIKQILATLIFAILFVSCKNNVNIDDVKYETPFIYYDGGLLTGSATTLYENGKIHKIINSNKGKIENQTHFNQQGDTIATMYYMEDGSFKKYVDKTIKNNIVEFDQCMEMIGDEWNGGTCIGSRNIPKFEYRLARLQDLWIKTKNLQEKLKNDTSGSLLVFEGSTRMGRTLGKTKMYLKGGVSYPSYYNKQPMGPFNVENAAFTVEYGPYMRKTYNERGRLSWHYANSYRKDDEPEVFKGLYNSDDKTSSQGLDFTAEVKYNYGKLPSATITLSISNKFNTYQSKMNFEGEEYNRNEIMDIWSGRKIESQPGYSFYNFNLEWHHLHNDEVAQAYSEKKFIDYMSKVTDNKVYTDRLVLGSYGTWNQNFTISGTKKRPITLEDGRTIEQIPNYYISTFYMEKSWNGSSLVEKYASVFKNFSRVGLPFSLDDFEEHKGEVYEIEYIKRNWVENYENPSFPSEGKFITKITLIE